MIFLSYFLWYSFKDKDLLQTCLQHFLHIGICVKILKGHLSMTRLKKTLLSSSVSLSLSLSHRGKNKTNPSLSSKPHQLSLSPYSVLLSSQIPSHIQLIPLHRSHSAAKNRCSTMTKARSCGLVSGLFHWMGILWVFGVWFYLWVSHWTGLMGFWYLILMSVWGLILVYGFLIEWGLLGFWDLILMRVWSLWWIFGVWF